MSFNSTFRLFALITNIAGICNAAISTTCTALLQKDGSICLNTPYGTETITEPVLIDLIKSKPTLRLKSVYLSGISALVIPSQPKRTRLDHSAGVLALLRKHKRPLLEQVAGLAHDLSHGVFSHTLDFVFENPNQQDESFESYIATTELPNILAKYNIKPHEINILKQQFPALKQKAPNICADILDGILGDCLETEFLKQDDLQTIMKALEFDGQNWFFTSQAAARRLGDASLYTVGKIYGSRANYMAYYWTAEALKKAAEQNIISFNDMRKGTDEKTWARLKKINNKAIQELVSQVENVESITLPGTIGHHDILSSTKFRCVDPWVKTQNGLKRLTQLDKSFKSEFKKLKNKLTKGLPILLAQKTGAIDQTQIFMA
ncbi:hypothetical protein KAU11_05295 [Candidatus Babeliales bacterium]|nr:hypothetical protein [Candidatus Babeliales bacterium]